MTLQHTPTPWVYAPTGNMAKDYSQPFAVAAMPNLIAGCFGDTPGGLEAAEANAAFIVKAVNAHDELVAALNGLISSLGEGGYFPTAGEPATRRAREALAKVST